MVCGTAPFKVTCTEKNEELAIRNEEVQCIAHSIAIFGVEMI